MARAQSVPDPSPDDQFANRLAHKAGEGPPVLTTEPSIEGKPIERQRLTQDPVHKVGAGKYQWGRHGKVGTKAQAERQARAIYASGWREDELRKKAQHLKASPRAESRYVLDVQQIMGAVHAAALHIVKRELGDEPEATLRQDAGLGEAKRRIVGLLGKMRGWIKAKVHAAFGRMSTEVRDRTAEGTKLLGIQLRAVPKLSKLLDATRDDNVALITRASQAFLDQVSDTLDEYEGKEPDELADALEERVGVSSARAQLVARDQTLKLNAQVMRARHEAAGVTSYRWSTSQDERVRPGHRRLNGKVFDYDDPPDTSKSGEDGDTNNPGDDFQCRCVAVPIIDDLDPDDGAENAETGEADDEGRDEAES